MDAIEEYENGTDYMPPSSWSESSIDLSTELKIDVPIFSVCFVLGLAGNVLVIYSVIKSKRLHNAPCLLLANLAVADLLTIVVMIPLLLTLFFLSDQYVWTYGAAFCRLKPYIFITPPVCSIFTMIAISIERYYVVLHPLRAKFFVTIGRVKKKLITINYRGEGLEFCWYAWPNHGLIIAYYAYICSLVFFIPLIIVTYIYIRIGFHLHRTRKGMGYSKAVLAAYRNSSGWSSGSYLTSQTQNITNEEETEMDSLRSVPSRAEDDSSAPRRHRTSDEGDNIQVDEAK